MKIIELIFAKAKAMVSSNEDWTLLLPGELYCIGRYTEKYLMQKSIECPQYKQ